MARGISNKKLAEIKKLNQKISQKKSRIKTRYGVEVDINAIDTSLRGKDLANSIEKAKSFLNRNNQKYQYVKNDKGVVFTKAEVTRSKLLFDRINRVNEKELKKLGKEKYTVEGRVVGTVASINSVRARSLNERYKFNFNLDRFRSRREFETFATSKEESYKGDFIKRRRHHYRANYISALREAFGDASDVEQLIGKITQLDLNEFYRLSMTSDERNIEFVYNPEKRDTLLQSIGESWGIDLGLEAV